MCTFSRKEVADLTNDIAEYVKSVTKTIGTKLAIKTKSGEDYEGQVVDVNFSDASVYKDKQVQILTIFVILTENGLVNILEEDIESYYSITLEEVLLSKEPTRLC